MAETLAAETAAGWQIFFKPHRALPESGHDPLLLIAKLNELGPLTVELDSRDLPPFTQLTPQDSFLSWQMRLMGDIPLEAVNKIFEGLEHDCELSILPLKSNIADAEKSAIPPAEAGFESGSETETLP